MALPTRAMLLSALKGAKDNRAPNADFFSFLASSPLPVSPTFLFAPPILHHSDTPQLRSIPYQPSTPQPSTSARAPAFGLSHAFQFLAVHLPFPAHCPARFLSHPGSARV